MIFDSHGTTAFLIMGSFGAIFCFTQFIKTLERGRADRLIEAAKRDADGATIRCLNDLSARIRSDSDSFTNRFERWLDRSLRAPARRHR